MISNNFPRKDNGTEEEFEAWLADPNAEIIDWSKVTIEGEPYDGPPVEGYSDIQDINKIRDTQEYKDELPLAEK